MKWSYIISFAAGILFFTLLTWSPWWLVGGAVVFLGIWIYQVVSERRYMQAVKTATFENQLRELEAKLDRSANREQQLTRVAEQAMTAKKKLLVTINQEIRTPVNGIAGMASLLTETAATGQQREYINGIQHCTEQLVAVVNHILVDDLLNTSLVETDGGQPQEERLDLRATIKDVLGLFAGRIGETGPALSSSIDDQIPQQLGGDGGKIKQILLHLVDNAVRHTTQGEISVDVRLLNLKNDGTMELGFEVRDTGNGIPASRIGQLFKGLSPVGSPDRAPNDAPKNPGLGLVVCRRLAEMMNGSIGVHSEPGKGCTFSFRVCVSTVGTPVLRQPATAPAPAPVVTDEIRTLALKI